MAQAAADVVHSNSRFNVSAACWVAAEKFQSFHWHPCESWVCLHCMRDLCCSNLHVHMTNASAFISSPIGDLKTQDRIWESTSTLQPHALYFLHHGNCGPTQFYTHFYRKADYCSLFWYMWTLHLPALLSSDEASMWTPNKIHSDIGGSRTAALGSGVSGSQLFRYTILNILNTSQVHHHNQYCFFTGKTR